MLTVRPSRPCSRRRAWYWAIVSAEILSRRSPPFFPKKSSNGLLPVGLLGPRRRMEFSILQVSINGHLEGLPGGSVYRCLALRYGGDLLLLQPQRLLP